MQMSEFSSLVNSLNLNADLSKTDAVWMLNSDPSARVNLGCGAATMCCWWEIQKSEIFLQSSVNLDSTSVPFSFFSDFFFFQPKVMI